MGLFDRQGPQPKLPSSTTTPMSSVRAGAGQNAKGTANQYRKPKKSGFFQYGSGQYGFLNPQGSIDWEAQKPPVNRPLIARPVGKPPVAPKPRPAPWMDPQYMKESRGMEHELSFMDLQAKQNLARMRDAYGVGQTSIGRAIGSRAQKENAGLASAGFSIGGAADTSVLERERDQRDAMRQLDVDFGGTRQEEIEAQIKLLRTQLADKKQILGSEARKRFEAYNKVLEAAGETPRSIEREKGFKKKGSTWFYTNPQGVTVSLGTETPAAMRKKLRAKKQGAANKVEKINGQNVNVL